MCRIAKTDEVTRETYGTKPETSAKVSEEIKRNLNCAM